MNAAEIYKSFAVLRESAIKAEMNELAIAYGWTMLRIGEEILQEKYAKLR